MVIQRLEQERAEAEAATAGPAGVDDINTDDEVPSGHACPDWEFVAAQTPAGSATAGPAGVDDINTNDEVPSIHVSQQMLS